MLARLPKVVAEGTALIIVPPLVGLEQPVLGPHVLQACARQAGHRVSVLYANMLFARAIGCADYDAIVGSTRMLLALASERLFARSAHGVRPLGAWARSMYDVAKTTSSELAAVRFPYSENIRALSVDRLFALERVAHAFVRSLGQALARLPFRVFGCSLMCDQTNAALALLRRVRQQRPDVVTVLGGASCAHPMGEGLLGLDPNADYLDYVFSGDCETAFPNFLDCLAEGKRPAERLLRSEPCRELDRVPLPDYREFFEQRKVFLPRRLGRTVSVPYETSRGCWWGEKSPCTFCGHAYDSMKYRSKSASRAVEDLQKLLQRHGVRDVLITDSILPKEFLTDLVPRLGKAKLGLRIFCDQRPTPSLRHLLQQRRVGIVATQSGIESFSSSMLRRMRKGVLARQNLLMVRNASAVGVRLSWCLLWGLPGDRREEYEAMIAILRLVHHLQPPFAMHHSIARFGTYHGDPCAYGLADMAPYASYAAILPKTADVEKIARFFHATSAERLADAQALEADVVGRFLDEIAGWRKAWFTRGRRPPMLHLTRSGRRYVLWDTRGLPDVPPFELLTRTRAKAALLATPYQASPDLDWAIARRIGVLLDGWYVPLTTADAKLLLQFEEENRTPL